MKHIYRITFESEGLRSRFFGVASNIETATDLACEKSGLSLDEVTNAVAISHLDFEEVSSD